MRRLLGRRRDGTPDGGEGFVIDATITAEILASMPCQKVREAYADKLNELHSTAHTLMYDARTEPEHNLYLKTIQHIATDLQNQINRAQGAT